MLRLLLSILFVGEICLLNAQQNRASYRKLSIPTKNKKCTCYKQVSTSNENVYLQTSESNPFNEFRENLKCLSSVLHVYNKQIDLAILYHQFIGNNNEYLLGLDSMDIKQNDTLIAIKIYGIHLLTNTSHSTFHHFEVDYDINQNSIESIRMYDDSVNDD